MERGVIYARYSSHNQKEESIEQQVEECMAFAQANKIEIVHIYSDKAVSGKSDKRTQFQRMMRDAEKKEFRVVVSYKSNRIARNMLQALTYESKLDLLGIKTLYAKEEFGNTAAGRFALRTMMNVNQFYSENMAEDIKRGMTDNAMNCKVNGVLPLGYVKGEDGKYAID
jgi:DNA invertase Pin-like site-specific DNA recombinase